MLLLREISKEIDCEIIISSLVPIFIGGWQMMFPSTGAMSSRLNSSEPESKTRVRSTALALMRGPWLRSSLSSKISVATRRRRWKGGGKRTLSRTMNGNQACISSVLMSAKLRKIRAKEWKRSITSSMNAIRNVDAVGAPLVPMALAERLLLQGALDRLTATTVRRAVPRHAAQSLRSLQPLQASRLLQRLNLWQD